MTSPQKAKGSGFEREVAKFLTELYDEPFLRCHSSGAFVGGSNTSRKAFLHESQTRNFKGDVIPGPSFPHFNIEAKFYADFPFHQLYTGECKQLDTWLQQLLEAADAGDLSVLMMKFNRKGRWIAAPHHHNWTVKNHTVYNSPKYGDWTIMEFNTFFDLNKVLVKELAKKQ